MLVGSKQFVVNTYIYNYMCVTYSEKAITYNKCACVAINCENRDTT